MSAILEPSLAQSDMLELVVSAEPAHSVRPDDNARFVTFFLGEDLYGISADEVAEVTHPLPVSPLPSGPEFLGGISPLRGEIVAVVDLQRMLGGSTSRSAVRPKIVVLRSADNETQPAFKVDRMHELMSLDTRVLTADKDLGPVILATAKVDERIVKVIKPEAVRDALRS